MDDKAWFDAVDNAVSLAAASTVVSNFLNDPGHDRQAAVQLIAAFRARRVRQKTADASIVAAHRRSLIECVAHVQVAYGVSLGQSRIYEDETPVLSSLASSDTPHQ